MSRRRSDAFVDEWGPIPVPPPPDPVSVPAALPPPPPELAEVGVSGGSEPPEALIALGEPPADSLECQAYMYRAAAILVRGAMLDRSLTEAERRREVRMLMSASQRLVPETRLWEAVRMISQDRAELEERRRKPQLEPVGGNPARQR